MAPNSVKSLYLIVNKNGYIEQNKGNKFGTNSYWWKQRRAEKVWKTMEPKLMMLLDKQIITVYYDKNISKSNSIQVGWQFPSKKNIKTTQRCDSY